MDTSEKKPLLPIVPVAIGIKPANSNAHEWIRLLLVVVIMYMIYNSIHRCDDEPVCLDDISDVIKPGTVMYQSIHEMDAETQQKYLKSLKGVLETPDPVSKYTSSLQASMIAGIATEYIVNGNLSKPIGIIAKTIMYSLVSTMYSLKK